MKSIWIGMLVTGFCLCTSLGLAGDKLDEYLRLKNSNEIFRGEIVKLEDTSVTLKTAEGTLLTFKFSDVRARDIFKIKYRRVSKTDEAALVDLAAYAIDNRLLDLASSTLDMAQKLRGDLQDKIAEMTRDLRGKQAKVKLGRAVRLNELATAAVDLETFVEARDTCREVMDRFSDTDYAHDARLFLEEILENERLAKETIQEEKRLDKERDKQVAEAEQRKRLDFYLKRVEKHLIAGRSLRDQGLEAEANGMVSMAVYSYRDAEKHYKAALATLDKYFFSVRGQRVDYMKQAEKARKILMRALKHCYIEWASTYVSIPNWKKAKENVIKALSIDPEDESALEYFKLINENYIERSIKRIVGLPK